MDYDRLLCRIMFWVIITATVFGITEQVTHYTFSVFERNVLISLGFIGLAITNKKEEL